MGSLRNPIGPLPASVYWRRRVVVLTLALLLILLVVWAVSLVWRDGGTTTNARQDGKGPEGDGPATVITPGPTDDPSATISHRPGGRDEIGEDADEGTGGSSGGGDRGDGNAPDDDGASATGGGDGGGLRACTAEDVTLELDSARDEYPPGDDPKIRLTVSNTAASACAVDFAPTVAVVTITRMDDDATVWSSAHCPKDRRARPTRVPAGGTVTHTVTWNRTRSAATCATPTGGAVDAGTYQVKARLGDLTDETSFVLVDG